MPDPAQDQLDLAACRDRLKRLRICIERRDAAADEVRVLTAKLRQAKQRLKEAGWNLSTAIADERRRG